MSYRAHSAAVQANAHTGFDQDYYLGSPGVSDKRRLLSCWESAIYQQYYEHISWDICITWNLLNNNLHCLISLHYKSEKNKMFEIALLLLWRLKTL